MEFFLGINFDIHWVVVLARRLALDSLTCMQKPSSGKQTAGAANLTSNLFVIIVSEGILNKPEPHG
jgi:hypothetical protein